MTKAQNISSDLYKAKLDKSLDYLKGKSKILFVSTSNRWSGEKNSEIPKSLALAKIMARKIGSGKVKIIDITKLNIYPCEGNVSTENGNTCGLKSAVLKDKEKNPSGLHRCWASINNPDDELWILSKEIFEADAIIFFSSVRWGQLNSYYQKLIERLTWIENRHSSLGEENIVKKISAGLIITGHNWNGEVVLNTQKQVLDFYGFNVVDDLCWNWQYTNDENDESEDSYIKSVKIFKNTFKKAT